MTTNLSEFYPVFFDESEEHLAAMERLLLGLDSSCASNDELNAIFRAAHSIKGSSSMFGFNDIADLTHELETLLDRLRKHELAITADMVEVFLQARDVIKNPPLSVRSTVRMRRWYMDRLSREVMFQTAPVRLYLTEDFQEAAR
ncbi:MAG: Hpt domain-containing protein, partial [Burkholderiales bacterium]